jgi:hypothetical protein
MTKGTKVMNTPAENSTLEVLRGCGYRRIWVREDHGEAFSYWFRQEAKIPALLLQSHAGNAGIEVWAPLSKGNDLQPLLDAIVEACQDKQ